jgi:hypothetical protein
MIRLANGGELTRAEWINFVGGADWWREGDDEEYSIPLSGAPRQHVARYLEIAISGFEAADRLNSDKNLKEPENALRQRIAFFHDLQNTTATIASNSVLIAPLWIPGGGRVDCVIANGIGSALAYALLLFCDERLPLGRSLCRCRFSECSQFFFKKAARGGRSGAPVRKYCCDDHKIEGNRERSRELQRKKRRQLNRKQEIAK